jgi:hypothetical protein
VPKRPLASDTAEAIEQRQIAQWRGMTAAQKAALVSGLTRTACELALAGIRHRFPHATPREQFLRLAVINLGPELARKVYPEIESLDLT